MCLLLLLMRLWSFGEALFSCAPRPWFTLRILFVASLNVLRRFLCVVANVVRLFSCGVLRPGLCFRFFFGFLGLRGDGLRIVAWFCCSRWLEGRFGLRLRLGGGLFRFGPSRLDLGGVMLGFCRRRGNVGRHRFGLRRADGFSLARSVVGICLFYALFCREGGLLVMGIVFVRWRRPAVAGIGVIILRNLHRHRPALWRVGGLTVIHGAGVAAVKPVHHGLVLHVMGLLLLLVGLVLRELVRVVVVVSVLWVVGLAASRGRVGRRISGRVVVDATR